MVGHALRAPRATQLATLPLPAFAAAHADVPPDCLFLLQRLLAHGPFLTLTLPFLPRLAPLLCRRVP